MALFNISRYLGEDEEITDQKPRAADILEKIKSEARKRKEKQAGKNTDQVHETSNIQDSKLSSDVKDQSKTKNKKRKISDESINSDKVFDKKSGEEKTKHEETIKTKKKRKVKNDTDVKGEQELSEKNKNETIEIEEHGVDIDKDDHISLIPSKDDEDKNEGDEGMEPKEGEAFGRSTDREIGGFTVIGDVRPAKVEKVHRVLPEWLSSPTVVSGDMTSDRLPVEEMPGLAPDLVQQLKDNSITHFFPVQRQVIPALLESSLTGFQTGRAGYRPSDVCVSAPTGSGKTLAFVIPIIQALRTRVRCRVRALAVLPVTDLATQVFKVFQSYCKNTCLKVGLLIGQKTLAAEQQMLVKKMLTGSKSQYDIVVATPGRLVDHINKTEGFDLSQLRYLVIDEADRMMDEIKQDWLIQVENAVKKCRPPPGPLTAVSCQQLAMPLQKLLYSATLSQNPEKLQQLNLFQPKLFTSVLPRVPHAAVGVDRGSSRVVEEKQGGGAEKGGEVTREEGKEKKTNKQGEFVGKYTTPASLLEYYIETVPSEKPLVILHLLHNLGYRNILCFTNSLEATHRLYLLVKLVGGVTVKEFSSGLHVARRDAILNKFAAGKIDILVCSDAMARGMDVGGVKYVVSYEPPPYIQTYIHRIGRTARAGNDGTALTLLQRKEFFHFKKMIREAGKDGLQPLKVVKSDLKPLLPKYEEALTKLADILEAEKQKKTPHRNQHRKTPQKKTDTT